jgi:hypothetical protein
MFVIPNEVRNDKAWGISIPRINFWFHSLLCIYTSGRAFGALGLRIFSSAYDNKKLLALAVLFLCVLSER